MIGQNAEAGPSNPKSTPAAPPNPSGDGSAIAAKIAKNKRLPATMVTPSGTVQPSKHKTTRGKNQQMSKKQKARSEKGRERAVELSGRLEEKVKGREERKAKRNKAKNAWD